MRNFTKLYLFRHPLHKWIADHWGKKEEKKISTDGMKLWDVDWNTNIFGNI